MYINTYEVEHNATMWRQEQQAQAAHNRLLRRLKWRQPTAPFHAGLVLLERIRRMVGLPAAVPSTTGG